MERTKKAATPTEPIEEMVEPIVEKAVVEENNPVDENKPVDQRIRWKKMGGGSLRIRIGGVGRIIKPNEVFLAKESEIPAAFRDNVIALEALPKEVDVIEAKAVKPVFQVVPRGKSKTMFDVVDSQGKLMNDKSKPLPKSVAEQLKKSLEAN